MEKTELLLEKILAQCRETNLKVQEISNILELDKQLLNVNDFCKYTGMSKATVYRLTAKGLVKHFKPTGSLIYFKRSDVDNFLQQNPVQPVENISDMAAGFIIRKAGRKLTKRKN